MDIVCFLYLKSGGTMAGYHQHLPQVIEDMEKRGQVKGGFDDQIVPYDYHRSKPQYL